MEEIVAKNKSEYGAKKRELIQAGYEFFDCKLENFSWFLKKLHCIKLVKGWKRS